MKDIQELSIHTVIVRSDLSRRDNPEIPQQIPFVDHSGLDPHAFASSYALRASADKTLGSG